MERRFGIFVKGIDETLDFITQHKASVARFGDGEMDIIAGNSIPYQDYDADLASRLRDVLSLTSDEHFVVCLSDVFEGLERYNDYASGFWQEHLTHYASFYQELCRSPWYGSTFISRPYIDLVDKSVSSGYFAKIKSLWQDKDVLIVEGVTSRSGVGNDLFEHAKSVERIICPSRNAYSKLEAIKDAVREYGKGKLVLFMLGPTAKILSYDLSQEGFHCLDIGHIDSEYEWFKMGASHKVKLSTKHTAEHNFDQDITFEASTSYDQQVIQYIGVDENK